MIHREGYKILTGFFALMAVLCCIVIYFELPFWVEFIVDSLTLIFGILFLQFFRNPKRKTPVNPNYIIAPADGKMVVIEETEEIEYFKDKRRQISIFMSPFNVHVNRFPVGGTVKYVKYHPGLYLVAWHPKSSTENERTTIVVKTDQNGEVLFRQIAGAVARRIKYYCSEGDQAEQGAEMGFIKFGSRVDVFLPLTAKVNSKLNDIVKGGETVIAEF